MNGENRKNAIKQLEDFLVDLHNEKVNGFILIADGEGGSTSCSYLKKYGDLLTVIGEMEVYKTQIINKLAGVL